MMKKPLLLAGLLSLCLTLTACTSPDVAEYYQTAQLYLGCGDYAYAADLFTQLGEYEDAADYALYARALQAMDEEDAALARANLLAVDPFKSSGRYLLYLDAQEAEAAGKLEDAHAIYAQLGSFCDSHLAVKRLQEAIPEAAIKQGRSLMNKGEYEKARSLFLSLEGYGDSKALADNCTAALNRAAYDAAKQLADAGDLLGAMEAFTAMGDTLDAARQAENCRVALHKELEERSAKVTLADAPALLEAYAALGDELAAARAEEINARFGRNLALIAMDAPLVQLGVYPQAESGEELPVVWRVIKAEGDLLTLLSEQVLDASAEAAAVPVVLADEEKSAASEVMLPAMAELAALADMSCAATPYALAQGADGSWWLRDSLENGVHPVIGASGSMTLPAQGAVPGVRPVITIDLNKITFTAGSGTAEDPFRIQ